jgi:hypothetical protein
MAVGMSVLGEPWPLAQAAEVCGPYSASVAPRTSTISCSVLVNWFFLHLSSPSGAPIDSQLLSLHPVHTTF